MGKYLDYNGVKYLWQKIFHRLLPAGGSSGQVLAKSSGADHDVNWITPPSGGQRSTTVLYDNPSGSNGNITLSQSAANFDYLRIYTFNTDGVNGCQSYDIHNPNGKYVFLSNIYTSTAHAWTQGRCIYINGTSISTYNNYHGVAQVDGSSTFSTSNFIYIYRVEAWNDEIMNVTLPLAISQGGTNATTVDQARANLCVQDTWYGTCSTAAGTRAKVVTCSGFTRRTGSIVTVYHSTACTVATTSSAAVTLNVNNTGAAAIAMRNGTTLRTTAANSGYSFYWHAGDYITYMFDGTYWVIISVKKSLAAPEYRSYSKTSGNVASSAGSVTITQTLDYGYDLLAVADPRTNGWVGSPYVGNFSFTRSSRSASATVWWTHNGSGTVTVDFIARWIGMVQN